MSTQKKADWKCTSCRKPAAETRSGSGSRLVRTSSLSDEASSDTEKDNSLMKKLEILWTKEFKDFEHRFTKKMNDRFEDFEKSLEFTSQRVDDMAVTMKNIEQKMILIEKKQEKNENEFKELKTKVKSLETELKELVQAGCNNKLELSGLPKVDNMNEKDVAKLFVEKVGINPEAIGHYEVEKSVKNNDSQRASTSLLISFRTPEIRNSVYETSVLRLINYLIKGIEPVVFNWLDKLDSLMETYFRVDKRTKVRTKLLDENEKYRRTKDVTYEFRRKQKFIKYLPYTKYGERLLEYKIPTLLDEYCTEILDETNINIMKKKLKIKLLEN
ncbi:hypothetical protein M8J75_011107 [Diaphorina citri]|nr:hypothetical protein M8J75_011107 [Diaphorina citri]